MAISRICVCVLVMAAGFTGLSTAHADDGIPPSPIPTAVPPIVQATAPVQDVPTVQPEPTQPPQPVQVNPEPPSSQTGSTQSPAVQATQPATSPSTNDVPSAGQSPAASGPTGTHNQPLAGPAPTPSGHTNGQHPPSSTSNSPTQSGPGSSPGPAPAAPADVSTASGVSLPDVNASSASAAAPAQLSCHGKSKSTQDPFMVSPFGNWTTINSYLDHDSPDYQVDGTIVIANGLSASSNSGQASDFFPSYWSPQLRQYVSYDGHNGYDFGISYQPVLAAADGTVTFADWNGPSESSGYGQMVLINHHNGYVTLYGHLSQLSVHKGQQVVAGQEIGVSGSTGNSSGPHLHFSVFHNCEVTDPYGWTGSGGDPLSNFDGEHASYLWLPGHDPLVLNPPPHWPAFPAGLHISLPTLRHLLKEGRRYVPPIDRLLLLDLPVAARLSGLSVSTALAVTESRITQEGDALVPYLEDLRSQGLLDSYQIIPAAAAVWVRGTASSDELLGLPSVASLSGVQPRDLLAAQEGLTHAVLAQFGAGQAPSLWPAAFRSATQTWRPVTTVSNGHALVGGFTAPGSDVRLTLLRRGAAVAAAQTAADPQTGAFVAMLHDAKGNPVETAAGDVVEADTAGHASRVEVVGCNLRARTYRITGHAPPNSTVALTLSTPSGQASWRGVLDTGQDGIFSIVPHSRLAAGTQAVASFVDAAGDEESVAAHVPGILASLGSPIIQGWSVSQSPEMELERAGKVLYHVRLRPAADGSFQVQLRHAHRLLPLVPGDRIVVGSRWHHRNLLVPALGVDLVPGSRSLGVHGPAKAHTTVIEQTLSGLPTAVHLLLSALGTGRIDWRPGSTAPGSTALVGLQYRSGDVIQAAAALQGITFDETSGAVSGQAKPGTTVTLRLISTTGRTVGRAAVPVDSPDGRFHTRFDLSNRAEAAQPGLRMVLREDGIVSEVQLPRVELSPATVTRGVTGRAAGKYSTMDLVNAVTGRLLHHYRVSGAFSLSIPGNPRTNLIAILRAPIQPSLTVERSLRLPATAPPARSRRDGSTGTAAKH